MTDRADRLAVYLAECANAAWTWDRSNCLIFAGGWVERERTDFFADAWRRACPDEASARRLLAAAGGADALVAREAARAGLAAIDPPKADVGAIGLVSLGDGDGGVLTLACIRTATRWAIRTAGGVYLVASVRLSPHVAWEV